jgi:hypothetical protein
MPNELKNAKLNDCDEKEIDDAIKRDLESEDVFSMAFHKSKN